MCEDRNGNLWIGPTVGGLKIFDKEKNIFVDVKSERLSMLHDITCMHEDSDGFIWMGKEDGSLLQYDHTTKAFRDFAALKGKFPIRALLEDKEGNLWIGTDKGGAFLFNEHTEKFVPLGEKDQNGTDVVLSFFNDAKGDMWLGTYHGGAYLFDKMDTTFNHLTPYPEIKHPEESNSVLSIEDDGKDLWLGTDGGGLVRKRGKQTQYYRKTPGENSVAGNTILCMTPGKNDQLYIGTYADGFSILDKKTGIFQTYNTSSGLNDNSVWTIFDNGDIIWIGTNKGGINLFDTRTRKFSYLTNILKDERTISSNTIRCIFKDSRGKIWVGTVSGLNLFNEEDGTFTSFFSRNPENSISNINVLCIYEDTRKNLWMGTHGGGINKYDYRTDTFISFQEKDGLSGNIVYGILEDAQGNLWMSTNKGISRFDVAKKEFKNFDMRSGLASSQFNVGSYCKSKDGRMYFGNIEGVSAFYPHYIRQNSFVPPVVITEFLLFNKPVSIGGDSPLQKTIEETSAIQLDHTQSVFSLKFAALNYTHPDKNNFQYKLEPFDKEWINSGSSNTATYTNLDPGTYTFKVKGSNNDGVWNDKFTSLTIVITPPVWKTLWFKILIMIAVVIILYAAYRIKVRTIKKQKEMLSELVTRRTAEIEEKNKLLLETEKKNAQLLHQKLNDELSLKSKELTNYALLIIQKNRLLDELKKKLKEVVRNPGSSNLRDFRNLVQMINYNFSPEKEWKEFNVNFNRVHEGFTDSLKARFPDLTNNDLRLCALYRTGIPTKDIAEAMGISQTSVKMARYRLRKKLSLSPEEDIHEFLLKS
jgi:ligand-binding sensor domain-containing protein